MYSLTIWAITIIRAQLPKADSISLGTALSAVLSGSTYIFSKERFLLLWILPFLLRFLFYAFKEQSRLRSGRKCTISIQTNPKTESVSERQQSAERLVLPMGKWCKAATPRQIELNQRNLKKLPKRISLMQTATDMDGSNVLPKTVKIYQVVQTEWKKTKRDTEKVI